MRNFSLSNIERASKNCGPFCGLRWYRERPMLPLVLIGNGPIFVPDPVRFYWRRTRERRACFREFETGVPDVRKGV